jgi:hypothetical protein
VTLVEPDPRCPKHMEEPTPYNCGDCTDARIEHTEWERITRIEEIHSAKETARLAAVTRKQAIDACSLCDEDGFVVGSRCNHDPEAAERAQRGAAVAREILTTTGGSK